MNAPQNQEKADRVRFAFNEGADGSFRTVGIHRSSVRPELPAAVFRLCFNEEEMFFFLQPVNDFTLPARLYGNVSSNVDRFLRSYCMNETNLGIVLAGERGSGKTITLKQLSKKALESTMPVILIDQMFYGTGFLTFMSSITQQCVVCFDEFDKTYSAMKENGSSYASKAQDSILQLLDGTVSSGKKIFVFTVNDRSLISEYLKDRPTRVRYTIPFKHLELKAVCEYVKENLKAYSEEHLNAFLHLALSYTQETKVGMNFDTMSNYVKEMNQFEEDLNASMSMMSIYGSVSTSFFSVDIYHDGKIVGIGTATAMFDGVYIEKDNFKLSVVCPAWLAVGPDKDGEAAHGTCEIVMTKDDFIGYFGSEFGAIEMKKETKKGELTFICKYINRDKHNQRNQEVGREAQAKRPVKLQNNSVSGAHVAGHSFAIREGALNWHDGVQSPTPIGG